MRVRSLTLLRSGFFSFAAALFTVPCAAQTPPLPDRALTLEDVLEAAEARSESMAIARSGLDRAEAERLRARSGQFPQLSATASYDRALASEFDGVFDTPATTPCEPFALNATAPIDARVAEIERAIECGGIGSGGFGGGLGGFQDLPFGRVNTWRASLSFSQSVYSGGRLGAQAASAAATREAADLTLTTTRGQLLFDVTQAYYDAALSARLVTIAEATLQQADATLKQVQAGFDAGTQPEFEVLRARVSRDNQTPVLIRQRVNREVAMLRLKQLLDLPPNYDLQLAEVLQDGVLVPPSVFASRLAAVEEAIRTAPSMASLVAQGPGVPLPQRAAVDAARVDVKQSEATLDLALAQKRPTVTFNSAYTRVAYPSGWFNGLDKWRTNWTVGGSVQMPILTGGRQRGDELAGRAQVDVSRARLQQVQELADLETRLAWAELLAARATWEASGGTVQQASRAYDIADVRYRAGVSTQLELSDSRLLLQQAEANRAQAARDVQVARARIALLPELPLGQTPPGGVTQPTQPEAPQPAPEPVPQQRQVGSGTFFTSAAGPQTQAGR